MRVDCEDVEPIPGPLARFATPLENRYLRVWGSGALTPRSLARTPFFRDFGSAGKERGAQKPALRRVRGALLAGARSVL